MSRFTYDPSTGQLAFPGAGRKRKRPAPADPRLDALFADRDAWLTDGGQLAWRAEQTRRRAARVERLRERRQNGYSTGPRRVKVTGDLWHGQVPGGAVYVGRQAPGLKRSKFASPFPVKVHGRDEALRLYREHLLTTPGLLDAARAELAGRDLACWCPPGEPCHAGVLLDLANAP